MSDRNGVLRTRERGGQRVTFMELFFDLVFVFAVTQLSHLLVTHLTWYGAAQVLLLLLAVWRAWMDTAWMTNWFDPDGRTVRFLLIATMLASLFMSATLPGAFGSRGGLFAVAYVLMQVGRSVFAVAALRGQQSLRRNYQRILAWHVASGVLWLAGAAVPGVARVGLWLAAVVVDYAGPVVGFWTPGLGRSSTTDWTITGGHLAERCQLFVIIALGESVLSTGATFSEERITGWTVAAFAVAFAGAVALWWIYFDRSAGAGSEVIESSADPGRLGRSAYTYFHVPMVAGIIVTAVADELLIVHPSGTVRPAAVLVALGGPALFLAGHALFKRAVFGVVPVSRLVAIGVLAVLLPLGLVAPPLLTAVAAVVVLAAVAARDVRLHRTVEV